VGGFAQHFRKVHVVQRQHLADDIEDAIGENGAHLIEFLQKPLKDAAFNNGLAFLGFGSDEVEGVALARLTDAWIRPNRCSNRVGFQGRS
jgi:hypothetical protein